MNGKIRHKGSIPEDLGSRYTSPALSEGNGWLEKPENLSFRAQLLFELSQKNNRGERGQIDSPQAEQG